MATRPDDVQYFKIFQSSVWTWKDFSEDRSDAQSSRPDVNLIKIELRFFWKDIVENCPDVANFCPDAHQPEPESHQF
jgi:hypothetical protein